MEEQFIDVKEAAEFLRISVGYLYKLTYIKAIPFYKPKKKLYFKKSELATYISNGKNPV